MFCHEVRLIVKSTLHSFLLARAAFSSALQPVYRKRLSSRPVMTSYKVWALGGVRDDIAYDTRLEVSPTGICSFLEGLGINSQPSYLGDLAVMELRWAATSNEFNLSLEELHLQPRPLAIGRP